jgi:hypothetical protein
MPDTAQDRDLAAAAIKAIDDRDYGHPAIHPIPLASLVGEVLPRLASSYDGIIPAGKLNDAVREVVTTANVRDQGIDELKTLLRAYRLIRAEADNFRIVTSSDVPRPWLGLDALAAAQLNQRQRFQYFAHLHMLAFPELLDVIDLFSPPGRSDREAEQAVRDRFSFTRKINANIAAYLVSVARQFGLVAVKERTYRNVWAPPAVLAALVVRSYLELTSFNADRGVDTADLLRQCAAVVPGSFFQRHPADTDWYRMLGAPPETFVREVGGAQLRIKLEGLIWFANAGLLAPLHCAYVLRGRRAKECFGRIRKRLSDRINGFSPVPVNADAVLTDLADM